MASHMLKITVTNPVKNGDIFGGSYISYSINTETNRHDFAAATSTVVRRYSDFVWLLQELLKLTPTASLPSLPEKQTIGRFSNDFVESRRKSLESFLCIVGQHKELSSYEVFHVFLQEDGGKFSQIKAASLSSHHRDTDNATAAAVVTSVGGSSSTSSSTSNSGIKKKTKQIAAKVSSWFDSSHTSTVTVPSGSSSVSTSVSSSKCNDGSSPNSITSNKKSNADNKVEEITLYVCNLEKEIINLLRFAEMLVSRNREIATSSFDFAQSIAYLGYNHGDDVIGSVLLHFGSSITAASNHTDVYAEEQDVKFNVFIAEYIQDVNSIKGKIRTRNDKKASFIQSLNQYSVRHAAVLKAEGIVGKEESYNNKQMLLQKAKDALDIARDEYESAFIALLTEFQQFKFVKSARVKASVANFVSIQLKYNSAAQQIWTEFTSQLSKQSSSSPLLFPIGSHSSADSSSNVNSDGAADSVLYCDDDDEYDNIDSVGNVDR